MKIYIEESLIIKSSGLQIDQLEESNYQMIPELNGDNLFCPFSKYLIKYAIILGGN